MPDWRKGRQTTVILQEPPQDGHSINQAKELQIPTSVITFDRCFIPSEETNETDNDNYEENENECVIEYDDHELI